MWYSLKVMLLWCGNKRIMKEVLKIRNILYLGFALLLAGCSGDEIATGDSRDDKGFDPVGKPVLFSVGLEAQATTRTASNMDDGRFVCTMYYHSAIGDTDDSNYDLSTSLISTAWLEVSGDDGNVVYMNSSFNDAGTPFYWKNRLKHAFLAIADNNQLTSTTAQPIYNSDNDDFTNEYDLRRGGLTSIAGQPDPILALTEFKPVGNAEGPVWNETAQAANRVTLNFKHQFSLIQVNVKNADNGSVDLTSKIKKVELLGVTTEGYVFSRINADGTVDASTYKNVDNSTSFEMFSTTAADGFLGSYNAIAFGHLYAIRVSWYEGTAEEPVVTHTPTLVVNENLVSGKRYIFNLSLSRGSLNVINTNIVDWALIEYNLNASIIN